MPMEGRYNTKSQGGGVYMPMEGRYNTKSQGGGVYMPMEGRYNTCCFFCKLTTIF
jgi:hypothetical protein